MNVAKLKEMRRLIAEGWTQGAAARDRNGNTAGSNSEDATCFCIIGASWRARQNHAEFEALGRFAGFDFAEDLIHLNDAPSTRQADILDILDRAIEHYSPKPAPVPKKRDNVGLYLALDAIVFADACACIGHGDFTQGAVFLALAIFGFIISVSGEINA